nr:hypothetical protein [Clostridioides sp.]
MNNEIKEALKVLIENNLSDEQINIMFDEFKKTRQVEYEFEEGEQYCFINGRGNVRSMKWEGYDVNIEFLENFNAFPEHKKKQLEYLAKKQLLERRLFTYSDLHGAANIDWKEDGKSKYYIVAGTREENEFDIYVTNMHEWSWFNDIYFNTREDAENALNHNESLIKEVLRMQRELYKNKH